MKSMNSLGRTGLGVALLFAGPIGWIIGGTVGLSGVVGLRNQSKGIKEAYRLADKNLEEEDVQSKWL